MHGSFASSYPYAEETRLVALFDHMRALEQRPIVFPHASGSEIADLHWFVLTVAPLCEKAVASRLTRMLDPTWSPPDAPWTGITSGEGVATFVPIATRKVRKRGSRYDKQWMPMPRYVFLGLYTAEPPWLWIRQINGVQGVLCLDGKPAELAPEIIGALMLRAETGQFNEPEAPKVQRGMSVVATTGPFRDFEGRVTSVSRQTSQVSVVFDLFSKEPVSLSLDDVVSVAYVSDRMIG